jgi:hypothetical protein
VRHVRLNVHGLKKMGAAPRFYYRQKTAAQDKALMQWSESI